MLATSAAIIDSEHGLIANAERNEVILMPINISYKSSKRVLSTSVKGRDWKSIASLLFIVTQCLSCSGYKKVSPADYGSVEERGEYRLTLNDGTRYAVTRLLSEDSLLNVLELDERASRDTYVQKPVPFTVPTNDVASLEIAGTHRTTSRVVGGVILGLVVVLVVFSLIPGSISIPH